MKRDAFVMYLNPGMSEEYQARHDDIWPALVSALHKHGVSDYFIFIEPQTHQLFATYCITDNFDADALRAEPIMQTWWQSMAPLMATKPNSNEPSSVALLPVFHML
ncbi:L-rhamnose mutarotase [Litorivicinus lipolyticus]|uniref:L-rhamnose mutarotase n=1 Tax=Litorivicinus lipolyticus TaxID=418701 RepID=A0A5Q2QEN4_9GAMM|nr:L-rhamnose mutarotase [Litorivicinus lipolyticus]QGG80486.1 L-rhamnose mutarotase [Litorivicinus lipolyticus]